MVVLICLCLIALSVAKKGTFLLSSFLVCKPPMLISLYISQLSLRVRMNRYSAGLVPLKHDRIAWMLILIAQQASLMLKLRPKKVELRPAYVMPH